MQAETKYVWLDLCAEAAICEDPTRLEQLAYQIAEILGKEQQRLNERMFHRSTTEESENRERGAA